MRKILFCLMMMGLALTATSCLPQQKQTSDIHPAEKMETPEQVAQSFCEAICKQDIASIKSILAAPEIAKSVDMGKMFEQLDYYDISVGLVQPIHETAIELNTQRLEGTFFMNLQYFYFGFFADDILSAEEKAAFQNAFLSFIRDSHMADQIVGLMEVVDYEALSRLEVYDVIDTTLLYNNDQLDKRNNNICDYLGADDYAEVIVIYQLGNNYYAGGMTLLQYEESWKIYNLRNNELSLFLGMVEPISWDTLDEIYDTMQQK